MTEATEPSTDQPKRRIDYDADELRLIGEWLNATFPCRVDSDGDRVIKAADTIDRLSGRRVVTS